jgi:transcriptional regulator with XRE-family HTH domain
MEAMAWATALGRRIRDLREELGFSQEDVAENARRHGLGWLRSTVAMVETGRRKIDFDEMFVLAIVLSCPIEQLLPAGDDLIGVSPALSIKASGLRRYLTEAPQSPIPLTEPAIPDSSDARDLTLLVESVSRKTRSVLLNDARSESVREVASRLSDDAGNRLLDPQRVLPIEVAAAAYRLWKRGFNAERDRRVDRDAPNDTTSRTRQALRGHITRKLEGELAEELRRTAEQARARQTQARRTERSRRGGKR